MSRVTSEHSGFGYRLMSVYKPLESHPPRHTGERVWYHLQSVLASRGIPSAELGRGWLTSPCFGSGRIGSIRLKVIPVPGHFNYLKPRFVPTRLTVPDDPPRWTPVILRSSLENTAK